MAKSAKNQTRQVATAATEKAPVAVPLPPAQGGDGSEPDIEGAEDIAQEQFTEEQKRNAVDAEWLAEKIGPYLVHYPGEKVFHITNDGQVFLDGNRTCAVDHQRLIAPGVPVITFNVE